MEVEYKLTEKFTEEVIGEINNIQKSEGLTPEQVVESARNSKSPLHDFFEWEDSVASAKWRLQQARVLINEVKVIIDSKEYYAFENVSVAVPIANQKGNSKCNEELEVVREYKPVIEILNNKDLREQIVRSALNHLAYWEHQNDRYSELAPIIKSAKKVRKQLNKKWKKKKK